MTIEPAVMKQVDEALPETTAEPMRAVVTVVPSRMIHCSDGVQRTIVCRGEVGVVDFYRGRP